MTDKVKVEDTEKSKRGKIFTIIVGLIILGVVIFRIVTLLQPPPVEEEFKVSVRTAKAELMNIESTSPISGKIEPVEEVTVMSTASGEVLGTYAEIGDKVKAGQVLFQVDGTQMSAMLNQAKESMAMAKATFDRMNILYSEGACSAQEYEQAKTAYNNAHESYRAASDAYGNTIVKSPISGYITAKNVSVGSMTAPTIPAMVVADVSSLIINTGVSDTIVNRIKEGDSVEIYVKTLGDKVFKGTIKAISPAPAMGALTYPVKIAVNSSEGELKAGMPAEIKIVSEKNENSICIPSEAVIIKEGKKSVLSVEAGGKVKVREVETGIDNGTYVEVISGIQEGAEIIIEGQQYASEGEMVEIRNEKGGK